MRLQTSLLSLFLPALVLAPYVDASAKNKKKNKNKKVSRISDKSTGHGDTVPFPSPLTLVPNSSTTSLVQHVPEESQVSERDEQIKKFEELINQKQYKEIAELGKGMSDNELLKCLCQVVTNLGQFKGLHACLKQRKMVPSFLAHGETVLVRRVVVEVNLLETNDCGVCDSIYDAIALSLKENRHGRVAGLFEAAQERRKWKSKFEMFVLGFFARYPPETNGMPFKRFFSLYGEEFNKKCPATSEIVCAVLVVKLKCQLDNPASQKLLIDLVGQPSLLTPAAFARGFLYASVDMCQAKSIEYGYKEAIEEGLKGEIHIWR